MSKDFYPRFSYDEPPKEPETSNLPIPGVFTAMAHPELFESCSNGTNRHDMEDYRLWWCFGLAWGRRCKKCSYKNQFAYD